MGNHYRQCWLRAGPMCLVVAMKHQQAVSVLLVGVNAPSSWGRSVGKGTSKMRCDWQQSGVQLRCWIVSSVSGDVAWHGEPHLYASKIAGAEVSRPIAHSALLQWGKKTKVPLFHWGCLAAIGCSSSHMMATAPTAARQLRTGLPVHRIGLPVCRIGLLLKIEQLGTGRTMEICTYLYI